MDTRQLSYFLGVASELHFSKAAERLFIAQPALSRQIQQLEQELGVLLFERDKRNVKLTPAGLFLQQEGIKLLSQLDTIRQRTQQIHRGEEGELRIGHPGSAVYSVLPMLLSGLRSHFPGIKAILSEVLETQLWEALLHYQIDIGFIREPTPSKEVNTKVIYEECFALVVPFEHPLNENSFEGIHQVQHEPFILPPRHAGSIYYDTLLGICEKAGFFPHIVHESNFGATILKLVEHGLGMSIMPYSYSNAGIGKVRFIALNNIPERTQLSVVWRKNDTNPILQNFLSLVEAFGG